MTDLLPHPPSSHLPAYNHFARRLAERFGADLDPLRYWWRWTLAIEAEDRSVATFRGRVDRRGRRLWQVDVEGRRGFVVFDHTNAAIITIMTDDEAIKCGAKGQRRIKGGFTNVAR